MRKRDYIRWLEGRLDAAQALHSPPAGWVTCPTCFVPSPGRTAAALATEHAEDRP